MREWLILKRKEKVLSQLAVASQAGISRAYYTQLELSSRTPSIRVAKVLAQILGFEWSQFFDEIAPLALQANGDKLITN